MDAPNADDRAEAMYLIAEIYYKQGKLERSAMVIDEFSIMDRTITTRKSPVVISEYFS